MCSFFLLERLRKDNEWFIAGAPAAHRPLVCVVWEYTSTQISCSYRPSYVEKAFAPSPEHRMGCLWPAFLWVFFLFFFPLPFSGCCLTLVLTWGVEPNHGPCGFRAAEACNSHCGCYRTPCGFVQEPPSCSIYPDSQVRQIYSHC